MFRIIITYVILLLSPYVHSSKITTFNGNNLGAFRCTENAQFINCTGQDVVIENNATLYNTTLQELIVNGNFREQINVSIDQCDIGTITTFLGNTSCALNVDDVTVKNLQYPVQVWFTRGSSVYHNSVNINAEPENRAPRCIAVNGLIYLNRRKMTI